MNLVKSKAKEASLDDIVDDTGKEFVDNAAREEFICTSFETLYKKPNNVQLDPNSVKNFLGTTAQHPIVAKAKLSQSEKEMLDKNLTIEELDESIKNAKTKSPPGADGLSNRFILTFWKLFRSALFKVANVCFASGKLTENFRNTNIKLIPKKGDLKQLKNWRPISLLNCFYKIISRAKCAHLKKVVDKLTPIGQKGYSKKKGAKRL